MDLGLDGRIGLVTGASAGIGRGIAELLADEGVQMVLVARRQELLESLAQQIAARGGREPLVLADDLADGAAAGRIHDAVMEQFGRLDILVNSAGRSTRQWRGSPDDPEAWKPPSEVDEEMWREIFAINFDYVRRLSHAFLPRMRELRWGRIVLIGGIAEPDWMSPGLAAKSAARAWAKGLSREVAADGVTINAVQVGRIMSEQILERLHPTEEGRRRYAQDRIPMGYFGEPADVAPLVALLTSDRARYITGQGMSVDGGMSKFAF